MEDSDDLKSIEQQHFENLGFRYYPDVISDKNLKERIDSCINNLLGFKEKRSTRSSGPVPFNAKYGRECWLASKLFNQAVLDPNEYSLDPPNFTRDLPVSGNQTSRYKSDCEYNDEIISCKKVKVWDRTPADSYKNKIPISTPLLENYPPILSIDNLARNALNDSELSNEKLYLVQVVKYEGNCSRGRHQDDLPNSGHIIVGYTAGHNGRTIELTDHTAKLSYKVELAPGSLYVMKNSVRYGNKLPFEIYGHGKIEHDVKGPSAVLIFRYGKPRPQDVVLPPNKRRKV